MKVISFDTTFSELVTFYIDGKETGNKKSLSSLLITAQHLNCFYVGEDGYSGSRCICDIAEAEVHGRAFTAEEVKASYERFVDGPTCP